MLSFLAQPGKSYLLQPVALDEVMQETGLQSIAKICSFGGIWIEIINAGDDQIRQAFSDCDEWIVNLLITLKGVPVIRYVDSIPKDLLNVVILHEEGHLVHGHVSNTTPIGLLVDNQKKNRSRRVCSFLYRDSSTKTRAGWNDCCYVRRGC